jgi:hypothetical protein
MDIDKKIKKFKLADFREKDLNKLELFLIKLKNNSDKKRIIIFTSYDYAIDPFRRFLSYLKKDYNFFIVFTMTIQKYYSNKYAKAIISIKRNFEELKYILEKGDYEGVFIGNIGHFWHWHFPFVKKYAKAPIICYERDFTNTFYCTNIVFLSEYFKNRERAYFEKESEELLLHESNGIIHHFSGKAKSIIKEKLNPNSLFFYPYREPNENYCFDNKSKTLVYGGSINFDNDRLIINKWGKLQNIFLALSQKYTVYIFAYFFNNQKDWNSLYNKKNIFLQEAIPINDFIKLISENCAAGLCLYNLHDIEKSYNHAYKYILFTKIFTYLSAGLPVIISEELLEASNFIIKNNFGVSAANKDIFSKNFKIDFEELKDKKESIKSFDFQKAFHCQIENFKNFLKTVL